MVTIARTMKDAPEWVKRNRKPVYVVADTRQDDTAFLMAREPAQGDRYVKLAYFDANGNHFDRDGLLVGVPLGVKPAAPVSEPGPATSKAAAQDAARDAARENDIMSLVSLRSDIEAMMELVRERESSGSPLDLSDVLDSLGCVLDSIAEACDADD